jgi:hypothetical protein
VYNGFLDESGLDHNFAVIEVFAFLDVHDVVRCVLDILPPGEELLVVGRGSSGQLTARTMNFSGDLRASEEDLHDKVNILFCFCYYKHGGNRSYFFM